MRLAITIIMSILFSGIVISQEKVDDLKLSSHLQPISEHQVFKTDGFYNWGSSIIKDEQGGYHLFYSRWVKESTFFGWLTHSEVAHAISAGPSGPWSGEKTVLQGRGKPHWDAITAHNPKIKFFEGRYYLYYISTNLGDEDYTDSDLLEIANTGYSHPKWKILRPNQRVGVAVSDSLEGPWERVDEPLIEPSGPITTLTVNPAISEGADGLYYLIVKGDKPNETKFIRNQAIAVSKSPNSDFVMLDQAVIDDLDTEDVSMWYDEGRERFYAVFHTHDFIGLMTSTDGRKWEKAKDYEVMKKQLQMEDESVIIPERLERPFVYYEDGRARVLTLAVKKGDASWTIFMDLE